MKVISNKVNAPALDASVQAGLLQVEPDAIRPYGKD